MFAAAGALLYRDGGAPARFRGAHALTIQRADQPLPGEPRCFLQDRPWQDWAGDACFLARAPGPVTLLWADSHGYQYRQAIRTLIAPTARGGILLYANAGCVPVFDVTVPSRPTCRANNDHVATLIRRYGVRRVVLAGHWRGNMTKDGIGLDALARSIARLRAMGVTVALVGDNPEYDFNNMPLLMQRIERQGTPGRPFLMTPKLDRAWNDRMRGFVGARDFVDPMAILCPAATQCAVYAASQPVMSESSHLSLYGARLVVRHMGRLFQPAD